MLGMIYDTNISGWVVQQFLASNYRNNRQQLKPTQGLPVDCPGNIYRQGHIQPSNQQADFATAPVATFACYKILAVVRTQGRDAPPIN